MCSETAAEPLSVDRSPSSWLTALAIGAVVFAAGNLAFLFFPWIGTSVDPANVNTAGIVTWGSWPADRTAFDLSVLIASVIAIDCFAVVAIVAARLGGLGNLKPRIGLLLVLIGGANLILSFLLVFFVSDHPLGADMQARSQEAGVAWEPLMAFWFSVFCSCMIVLMGVVVRRSSKPTA